MWSVTKETYSTASELCTQKSALFRWLQKYTCPLLCRSFVKSNETSLSTIILQVKSTP